MKKLFFVLVGLMLYSPWAQAQKTEYNNQRLEFSMHYGIGGNFFVTRYDEQQAHYYYSKDFIGTIGGAELVWNLKDNKQAFGLSYDQSVNHGEKNINLSNNGLYVYVDQFKLRQKNKMYGIFYRRKLGTKLAASVGFYLFSDIAQQLEATNTRVKLKERESMEGGFFLGTDYYFYKTSNVDIGVQLKLFTFFAISEFDLEVMGLSPKIRIYL